MVESGWQMNIVSMGRHDPKPGKEKNTYTIKQDLEHKGYNPSKLRMNVLGLWIFLKSVINWETAIKFERTTTKPATKVEPFCRPGRMHGRIAANHTLPQLTYCICILFLCLLPSVVS